MCNSDATDDGEAAETELPTLLVPPTRRVRLNVPGSHKRKCTNSANVETASIHKMIKEENDAMRKWPCYALLKLTRPRKKPTQEATHTNRPSKLFFTCYHTVYMFVY